MGWTRRLRHGNNGKKKESSPCTSTQQQPHYVIATTRCVHLLTFLVLLSTCLDLLKSDTAITTKKVEYKLRELAYKLDVEKKVKVASEKLEQLGMAAKDGNAESAEKVALLKRALQKYQGLYIPGQGTLL